MEEIKCHLCLQQGQGGSKERQAGQPHLHPCEGDGPNNPGNNFQTHEGHKCYQQHSAWIYKGKITPDKPDRLAW